MKTAPTSVKYENVNYNVISTALYVQLNEKNHINDHKAMITANCS